MKDKSSKSAFNKHGNHIKSSEQKDYSREEVIKNIDNMAKVAKTGQQKQDVLDIKDQYIQRQEQLNQRRYGERTRNYLMGMKAGIHPKETLERLEKQDKVQDQRTRNHTVKKAKQYYHQNYSVTKAFNESKRKSKNKDQDKDIDRD